MFELNHVWITFHRRPHRPPQLASIPQYPTTTRLHIPTPAAAESLAPRVRHITVIGAQGDGGGPESPVQAAQVLPPGTTRGNKVLQPEGRLIPLLPAKPRQRRTQFRVSP